MQMRTETLLVADRNDEAMERQLLKLFMAQLPDSQKDINRYTETGNLFRLERELHRLLGSCLYCHVPTLQSAVQDFMQVVRSMSQIDRALLTIYSNEFNEAVEQLLHSSKSRLR
jgi:hypothetical protein